MEFNLYCTGNMTQLLSKIIFGEVYRNPILKHGIGTPQFNLLKIKKALINFSAFLSKLVILLLKFQ